MLSLKSLTVRAAGLLAYLAFLTTANAQSTRPGWGSTPYHDASGTGVTFRVWAPYAASVFVPGDFNSWSTTANPLAKELTNGVWSGVWSADVTSATTGQQYKYYIAYSGGGTPFYKHDPRSRLVTSSGTAKGANDIIYDPTAFNWTGDSLVPPQLNDLFIYELHAGTFYTNGSPSKFIAATNKLDYLKNLGVNAVEVMPVAEFPDNDSWGYDPAQPFAVENIVYGGTDSFKTFVRACHLRGIAVLLDVVHNHYGSTDLDMWNFDGFTGGAQQGGIYFFESNTNLQYTPYANTRPNFSSNEVCNFIQDNFTMWLSECHVDGFRWDTPGLMMNASHFGVIPAASNLVGNINAMIHTNYTGKISIAEDVYNSFGFDSAWDTSFPSFFLPVLTNASDAGRSMITASNAVMYNVRYGGASGPGRVAFLESHDVVGDLNNGVRTVTAIDPATPNSYHARKLSTLGAAVTLTAPGVPMIFQGEEMLENQSFDSALPVDWTKTNTYSYIVQFYRDLISARRDLKGYTPGLEGDQCAMLQTDNADKLIAFHRWKSTATNQDAIVVANFLGVSLNNYPLNFPSPGTWYVHLNGDSTTYGPDYGNIGPASVTASGIPPRGNITIGPYSALILSQTPNAPPQLTVSPTNNIVTVSWPSTYFEWVLYQSASMAGNSWTQVPPALYQTNTTATSISVTLTNGNNFYRLQKQ